MSKIDPNEYIEHRYGDLNVEPADSPPIDSWEKWRVHFGFKAVDILHAGPESAWYAEVLYGGGGCHDLGKYDTLPELCEALDAYLAEQSRGLLSRVGEDLDETPEGGDSVAASMLEVERAIRHVVDAAEDLQEHADNPRMVNDDVFERLQRLTYGRTPPETPAKLAENVEQILERCDDAVQDVESVGRIKSLVDVDSVIERLVYELQDGESSESTPFTALDTEIVERLESVLGETVRVEKAPEFLESVVDKCNHTADEVAPLDLPNIETVSELDDVFGRLAEVLAEERNPDCPSCGHELSSAGEPDGPHDWICVWCSEHRDAGVRMYRDDAGGLERVYRKGGSDA